MWAIGFVKAGQRDVQCLALMKLRQTRGLGTVQINAKRDGRWPGLRKTQDTNLPRFDQPCDGGRYICQQCVARALKHCPVVRHQISAHSDKLQRKRRLARAGLSGDQNGAPIYCDARGMNDCAALPHENA